MLVICRWQLCLQWHLWVLLCWIYAYVMTIHTKCNQNNFFLVSFVFFHFQTLRMIRTDVTNSENNNNIPPIWLETLFDFTNIFYQVFHVPKALLYHLFISYTDRLIIENRTFWNHLIFVIDFFNSFSMLKRKFRSEFSIVSAFILF